MIDIKPYIYCIVNTLNGKMYIGQHCGKKYNYFGSGIMLHRAYKKWTKEVFSKFILEYCDQNKLNEREIYWISYYNTCRGRGYNITEGGGGNLGYKYSPESIAKMKSKVISQEMRDHLRKINTGKSPSKEAREKISKKLKGIKKKPFTEEHKINLSKGQKGIKRKPFTEEHLKNMGRKGRKPVFMYDKNWNFIQEFTHMSIASDHISGSLSEISKSCSDGKTTVKGFRFKLKNNV